MTDYRTVPVEPTEEMIDAPRGLIMYFNGMMNQSNWTLGDHAKSGGYGETWAHLITDEERAARHFPKAHQADLIWRAMLAAAPASPAPALGDQVERCAMALCVADGGDWSDHADRPDLQAALREEWRSGACAVIAAMQPVGWRATKDGCEVGLFYDEDIARENTTDAVIEPLFALPAPPGVGG